HGGRRANMTDCRRWQPIWFVARSPSSPHAPRPHPASQQRRQPLQYRSFSRPVGTRSRTASSPACIGPAAMSRGSVVCRSLSRRSGLSCCMNSRPKRTVIGLLVNPTNPRSELVTRQLEEAARALGLRFQVLKATSEGELDSVFASLVRLGVGALLVAQEPSYNRWLEQIIALASGHAIPTMYATRDFVVAGGLVSYDASGIDSFRQVGVYVGRMHKGEKAADLPVMQPTKFELVINLKTAKALGLEVPPTLLARADEVIE